MQPKVRYSTHCDFSFLNYFENKIDLNLCIKFADDATVQFSHSSSDQLYDYFNEYL